MNEEKKSPRDKLKNEQSAREAVRKKLRYGKKDNSLSVEEKKKLKGLPTTLEQALDALEADHDYLTAGGVFPEILLQNFIKNKRAECREIANIPNPVEFEKYYNL